MARPPRIGLTLELSDPLIQHVDRLIRGAVEDAGGLCVVIPHSTRPETAEDAYPLIDGVLMMGGPDVAPEHYGAEPHPLSEPGQEGFDTTELALARAALADGKPVLGICRGNQVLNVAARGTLVQDVPSLIGDGIVHMSDWTSVMDEVVGSEHAIRIDPSSHLAGWLGFTEAVVNSYHHQSIDRVGDGLRAVAWADDGVIEAIEGSDGRYALGLQWHNEFELARDARFAAPVHALVEAARRRSL